ncbi:hypothetical protein Pla22_10070 [Rubripirellula amarantea]|uniref:Uncharacterized protein n=1 Tax=Rubripirellula amarantea TaxID=2527999 RepID=A0A5C5WS81_9BACT|nr:hypothetical protein Pla22_10070 [Rubripirellula amarantea]
MPRMQVMTLVTMEIRRGARKAKWIEDFFAYVQFGASCVLVLVGKTPGLSVLPPLATLDHDRSRLHSD